MATQDLIKRGQLLRQKMTEALQNKPLANTFETLELFLQITGKKRWLRTSQNITICSRIGIRDLSTPRVWTVTTSSFQLEHQESVSLSKRTFHKLEQNYIVLELWSVSKDSNGAEEKLIGIVKLSLHPFYIAFSNHIQYLNHPYGIMSQNEHVEVVNPIEGNCNGQLHIMLAMGNQQQIETLRAHERSAIILQSYWRGYTVRKKINISRRYCINVLIEAALNLPYVDIGAAGYPSKVAISYVSVVCQTLL